MILTPSKLMHKIEDIKDTVNQDILQRYIRLPKFKRKKVEKIQAQFVDELRLALYKFTDLYNYIKGDLPDDMV